VDAVVKDVQEHGVTAKELADAKVRFRSNFYDEIESTQGRANLLASFALFHDDPSRINKVVEQFDAVTLAQVQDVARKILVPTNRTSIDRVPEVAK
jgi:predicted Zn-dependent peptidase